MLKYRIRPQLLPLLASALVWHSAAAQSYAGRDDVDAFAKSVVAETGLSPEYVTTTLAKAKRLDSVLEAMSKPAERVLTWKGYRPIFVTDKRLNAGLTFWRENRETLEAVSAKTGVPAEIIVAIIGVETYYGRYKGKHSALDSLATLAFDYPRRAKFFKSELKAYLQLTSEEGFDPTAIKGSYAAAMGMPQFISSSYRAYAVDGDGDGQRDLWNSTPDVIASVANYFVRHGWQSGGLIAQQLHYQGSKAQKAKKIATQKAIKPFLKQWQLEAINIKTRPDNQSGLLRLEGKVGDEFWLYHKNFYVITRYNHSPMYAMAVFQLGENLRQHIER